MGFLLVIEYAITADLWRNNYGTKSKRTGRNRTNHRGTY